LAVVLFFLVPDLVVPFVGIVPFSSAAVVPEDAALLTNATPAGKRDHQEVRKCKDRELQIKS
jgi:hypothetical protein